MPEVIIGQDPVTRQDITLGDIERQSGLYILGRQGTGKTTLIERIIEHDIRHRYGVFFLDPHGDALVDIRTRMPAARRDDVIILDPENG